MSVTVSAAAAAWGTSRRRCSSDRRRWRCASGRPATRPGRPRASRSRTPSTSHSMSSTCAMRNASTSGRALPATMMSSASSIRGHRMRRPLMRSNANVTSIVVSRPEPTDLAVALEGVGVAEVEVRAFVKDREKYRRALARVGGVHVAPEVAGPEAAERFGACRRHCQAAEHGLERHLDRLRRRVRQVEDAHVARSIETPDEAARRQRIVDHPRARVASHGADAVGIDRRHRRVAIRDAAAQSGRRACRRALRLR